MNRSKLCCAILFSAMIALCCLSVRADDQVDNPRYQVWSKFKPGSSSTLSADFERQGNKIHVDRSITLLSVDADHVEVETVNKAIVMDHEHLMPAVKETFPAKMDKSDWTQTGDKDVEAMGKTFKCKVWTGKISDPNAKNPATAMTMDATIYVSDEVPGGAVKFETAGKDGKTMTYLLTAMETK